MLVSGGNSVCFSLKLVGVLVGAFGALLLIHVDIIDILSYFCNLLWALVMKTLGLC